MKIGILSLIAFLPLGLAAQAGYEFLTFGDTASNNRGSACITDAAGNVYFAGTISTGSGESDDIYFCKIDASGEILWSEQYGSEKNEFVNNMIQSTDGYFYLCGDATDITSGNVNGFLLKLDSLGEQQWLKEYGFEDKNEDFYGLTELSTTDLAVVGFRTADAGSGNDVLVVKYDIEGNVLQKIFFGEEINDYGMGIVEGEGLHLYISGDRQVLDPGYNTFIAELDAEGNVVWDHENGFEFNNGCKTIMKNAAGHLILVGESANEVSPVFDIMISEIDTAGNFLWTQWIGAAGAEAGYDISEPLPGNYFITGFGYNDITANNDIIIVHTDGTGNELGRTYYGAEGVDYAYDVKSNGDGEYWISGFSSVQDHIQFALAYGSFEIVEVHNPILQKVSEIVVYPNPVNTTLHLESGVFISCAGLYSTTGILINRIVVNGYSAEISLDPGIPSGIYTLSFETNEGRATKLIVLD